MDLWRVRGDSAPTAVEVRETAWIEDSEISRNEGSFEETGEVISHLCNKEPWIYTNAEIILCVFSNLCFVQMLWNYEFVLEIMYIERNFHELKTIFTLKS